MKPRNSRGCGAWPSTSARQEKLAGLPASTCCTVSAALANTGAVALNSTLCWLTPISTSSITETSPRRLGSCPRSEMSGPPRASPSRLGFN